MPYRPPAETLVACTWMPRFEVQVERWRCPELAEAPLALLTADRNPVVAACSHEAEAAGLRAGMPLREVMATAPEAALRTADPCGYAEVFSMTLSALEGVSPLIEPGEPGLAFLGLEGLAGPDRIYESSGALAAALEGATLHPFSARIGI